MAYFELQSYETALDQCNEALRVDGDWGTESPSLAWQFRGRILEKQAESELALVALERTLLLEPDDSLTLTYQCQSLINLQRYAEAVDACQAALDGNYQWRGESPAIALYYKAIALSGQGEYLAAVAALDQAIQLDPNNAGTWTQQGHLLQQLDRPVEALASYSRAVELAPESSKALVGQCAVLNQVGQAGAALAACQQAIQGDGDWWPEGAAQAWSEQAQALIGAGMWEAAIAASNRAIGISPT
jgi:tetratricopeptide (TPR) repeat protein